jgi:hypothetical protein
MIFICLKIVLFPDSPEPTQKTVVPRPPSHKKDYGDTPSSRTLHSFDGSQSSSSLPLISANANVSPTGWSAIEIQPPIIIKTDIDGPGGYWDICIRDRGLSIWSNYKFGNVGMMVPGTSVNVSSAFLSLFFFFFFFLQFSVFVS